MLRDGHVVPSHLSICGKAKGFGLVVRHRFSFPISLVGTRRRGISLVDG